MKISIVLPCYNRVHLIGQALVSILAQTLAPHEIIIVDDGSSDDLAGYLATFYPQVRLIRQPNAGPAAARNTGFHAATGDLIALWDSDDLCPPTRLEVERDLFVKYPELDFVFGNEAKFTKDQAPVPCWQNHGLQTGPIDALAAIQAKVNIPTSSVMMRRSAVWAVGGMDESLRLCEDFDLWVRMAKNGANFGIVNEVLAHRRIHSGNLVNQRLELKAAECVVLERHDCLGSDFLRRRLSDNHYDLGSAYLKMMRWDKASEHLSRVLPTGVKQHVVLALKRALAGVAA